MLRSGFAPLISLMFFAALVASVFGVLMILRQKVTLSSQASEGQGASTISELADERAGVVHKQKVLYMILNPVDGGKDIASEYYSWLWSGKSLAEVNQYNAQINTEYYKKLSKGRVNFEVVKTVEITTSPKYTNGYTFTVADYEHCVNGGLLVNGYTCESQKFQFDHNAFLQDNNVCQIANDNDIDEIWLLSSPFITTWEAWMIGPTYGFEPNGGMYVDKKCKKHLIVMSAVYNKIEPMGHIYGHRIEATLSYLSTYWKKAERIKYIENFMNLKRYSTAPYGTPGPVYDGPGCGNAHVPLNGLEQYDYTKTTYRRFDCMDWNNLPDFKSVTKKINCEEWGCSDIGWNAYWQGAMPHRSGELMVKLTDGRKIAVKRDWWVYVLSPRAAINFVKKSMPTTKVSETPAEAFKFIAEPVSH